MFLKLSPSFWNIRFYSIFLILYFWYFSQISIIDKSGDKEGWWKAFDGRKIGYIPKEFVVPIDVS